MGQIKSRKPLLIGLIGILSLLGTGTAMWLTASFRHSSAVLQDQIETVPDLQISLSPEQLQSAQGFLDNMQTGKGFFAARYRGCFIQKDNKICQVFYPPKASEVNSATQRWNKAQLKLNKMGAGSRQKLTQKLLTQDNCEAPEFISALAFKLEEQLPSQKVLTQVLGLYEKAYTCALAESNFESRGLYRWGLLSIWSEKYDLAQKALSQFLEVSDNNSLKSRAQYWLNQIQLAQGNSLSQREAKKMWQQFPLSHHINQDVMAADIEPMELVSRNRTNDPLRRSETHPALNDALAFVDFFIANQRTDLIERVFEFFDYRLLSQAEPEVQLYVALTLDKYSTNKHNKFMVLSRLFQNHPQYKTLETLKIFYPLKYIESVIQHRQGQDPTLLVSLIRTESSFNPETVSPVGAMGLMQLLPTTIRELSKKATASDLLDPDVNIRLGAKYVGRLQKLFKGDVHKVLAAYNAGLGNVRKWEKRFPITNQLLFADLIPFDETREYVSSILRNKYWYSQLYPELSITAPVSGI